MQHVEASPGNGRYSVMDATGLTRFLEKRSIKVYSVEESNGGYRVGCDNPTRATQILSAVHDPTPLVFYLSGKPWYKKLLFWRK